MTWHLFHKWEAVGVQQRTAPAFDHMTRLVIEGSVIRNTDILWRCTECKTVKSTSVNGYWTLEQLKGRRE